MFSLLLLVLLTLSGTPSAKESCSTDNDCDGGSICFGAVCHRLSKYRLCYNWHQCGMTSAYRCLWGHCVPKGYVPTSRMDPKGEDFYYDLTIDSNAIED
ncbi:hypothetical protein QR680_005347 [Steinernema hermaphroditum]|uniref:Uncharacterized protein n=1 Tax=Steinernema hermaphroditum TaxID=289476 RepID=A0AA39LVG8_9BILA|nr:hypothetical protein QR680_005347 [Steinernema hermaphroditum]